MANNTRTSTVVPKGFVLRNGKQPSVPQGFVIRRPPQTFLGRIAGRRLMPAEIEAQISTRPDLLRQAAITSQEELRQVMPTLRPPAGGFEFGAFGFGPTVQTATQAIGGAFQRGISAIANPIIRLQQEGDRLSILRTEEEQERRIEQLGLAGALKDDIGKALDSGEVLFRDAVSGLTGQRLGTAGDIFKIAGVPENFANILGFLSEAALANLVVGGKAADLGDDAIRVTSPQAAKSAKAIGRFISRRIPKIFGPRWISNQVKNGRGVVVQLDDMLSTAFDDVYSKNIPNLNVQLRQAPVDPSVVDDILLRSDIDDLVLRNMQDFFTRNFGNSRIDTVGKVHLLKQLIRQRVPTSFFLGGGTTGRGGITNPKIIRKSVVGQLTNTIDDAIRNTGDTEGADLLRGINRLADEKVYPMLKKLRSIFGRERTPISTEQLSSTFSLTGGGVFRPGGGILSKAGQRIAIAEVPKVTRELSNYVTRNYSDDLFNLVRNSKDLILSMRQFRTRQLLKLGAAGTALGFGVRRGFREIGDLFQAVPTGGGGEGGGF